MNNVIIYQDNLKRLKDTYSPAIFLDRDGVIIKDQNYISESEKVFLEKGAKNLLQKAYDFRWKVVVITNQSGIARGYLDWDKYAEITQKMIQLLGHPGKITGIYANDVISDENHITWRKPSPKMLLQASKDLKIDLKNSILIGDRYCDLLAGLNAGLKSLYHVLTGHGNFERSSIIKNLDKNGQMSVNDKFSNVFFINSLVHFDSSILKNNIL